MPRENCFQAGKATVNDRQIDGAAVWRDPERRKIGFWPAAKHIGFDPGQPTPYPIPMQSDDIIEIDERDFTPLG